MRHARSWLKLLAVLVSVLTQKADADGPDAVQLATGVRFEYSCPTTTSSAQTVPSGNYLMRITGEDTYLCYAGDCSFDGGYNGEIFPVATVMPLRLCFDKFCQTSGSISCRSGGGTGHLVLTKSN